MTTQSLTHLRNGCFESHNSIMSQQLCTPRCSAWRFQAMPKKCFRIRDFFSAPTKLLWQYIRWRLDRIPLETTLPVDWIACGSSGCQQKWENANKKTTKNCQVCPADQPGPSAGRHGISQPCWLQCLSYYKSCENTTRTIGIAALMLREFDAIEDIRWSYCTNIRGTWSYSRLPTYSLSSPQSPNPFPLTRVGWQTTACLAPMVSDPCRFPIPALLNPCRLPNYSLPSSQSPNPFPPKPLSVANLYHYFHASDRIGLLDPESTQTLMFSSQPPKFIEESIWWFQFLLGGMPKKVWIIPQILSQTPGHPQVS